jgi:hypothetical protein
MSPPFAPAEIRRRFQSQRAASLNESVIREMSRLAIQHKAVNLAQGFERRGARGHRGRS